MSLHNTAVPGPGEEEWTQDRSVALVLTPLFARFNRPRWGWPDHEFVLDACLTNSPFPAACRASL